MRAHDDMGKPGVNITYETVKRAADANDMTVEQALETIARRPTRIAATIPRSTPADAAGPRFESTTPPFTRSTIDRRQRLRTYPWMGP